MIEITDKKKQTVEGYLYENYSKQTAKTYMYHIENYISVVFNHLKADFDTINEYLVAKNSTSTVVPAIKAYYDYLIYVDKRTDHPCKTLTGKRRKKTQIQFQDLFSRDELESLFNRENGYKFLDARNKLIISLLIYQGLTSGEIVRLKLKDFEEEFVNVRRSKSLNGRKLELKLKQANFLNEYLEYRDELDYKTRFGRKSNDYVFLNKRGDQMTVDSIHSMFEQFKDSFQGRTINPQTIRQSVIANWLNVSKFSIEKTQALSGQKYPSSTEHYKQKINDSDRDKFNAFYPLK